MNRISLLLFVYRIFLFISMVNHKDFFCKASWPSNSQHLSISDLGRCPQPPQAEDAEAAKGLLKTLSPASSLLQLSARDPREILCCFDWSWKTKN